MTPDATHPVKALLTMNDVLEALDELESAGVTQLADHIDRPPSVVTNHLKTLLQLEYVVQDGTEYQLGLRFLDLGERARHRTALYENAHPQVEELAEESGELITLLVEEHGRGVYLDVAAGSKHISYPATSGNRTNLHCSAVGKAVLAHLPDERIEQIIDRHGLPAQSPNTITDPETLLDQLEEVRDEGLAYDREEFREGLKAVGAPIMGEGGSVVGSISIAGPTHRMTTQRIEDEIATMLRQSVNVIELNIRQPNIQ